MMIELLRELEAALLKRNPGIAPALLPGVPADEIRTQLKRLGIKGNIEPIVQLYGWHNGAVVGKECEARRLGIAPPVVSDIPEKTLEFMRGLGHKIDGPVKCYNSFLFFRFDSSIRWIKHWKKFAATVPSSAKLALRFVPFISTTNSGEDLALDVTPEGNGRIVLIGANEKQVRLAYASFEEFLRDLIRANESNEVLSCVTSPGELLELEPIIVVKKPKPKTGKTIPVTNKSFVLRTDFSDDSAWEALKAKLHRTDDELSPDLDFISDPAFADLMPETLRSALPEDSDHSYGLIADRAALMEKDNPVLAVDLSKKKVKILRVSAEALAEVENNLSVGNMDFREFAKAVDEDGVFRGFRESESGAWERPQGPALSLSVAASAPMRDAGAT